MSSDNMTASNISEIVSGIRTCQPEDKLKSDTLAAKVFYRRAGYYVAALLWRLFGLKPNTISLISGALAIVTILVALFLPSIWLVSVLLIVIGLLDCADGALARYLQLAGPKGELADAIGGYLVLWSVPFITWLMLFAPGDRLEQNSLLVGLVSAIVVAFHYLGRAVHQKKALTDEPAPADAPKSAPGLMNRIQGDLSFCGFMFPVFIVFWGLGLPLMGWLYAVIFLLAVGLAGLISGIKQSVF